MKLALLLFILSSKFKKASRTDINFKKFLMGHECSIVVKTRDEKRGKRFIFQNGRFSADAVLDQFDAAMVWPDAGVAFAALKKGEDGIKEELKNHNVYIEGKLFAFTWFGAAINYVMQ